MKYSRRPNGMNANDQALELSFWKTCSSRWITSEMRRKVYLSPNGTQELMMFDDMCCTGFRIQSLSGATPMRY